MNVDGKAEKDYFALLEDSLQEVGSGPFDLERYYNSFYEALLESFEADQYAVDAIMIRSKRTSSLNDAVMIGHR